ncbi:hypothetical protein LL273_14000 [Marinobacter salarius]|uniref:hypothetical protein n=1 Tax=Marinobacter salarius TaxID=1420917 RepID=UPI001D18E0DA|nr:hypothetical protein [Marinobacter salarius]MCC4284839.1 hypothetical protein [Marinobacter salarius]
MKKASAKERLILIVGLLVLSVAAYGHPAEMDMEELVSMITQAENTGKSDLVSLIIIFLTIFTISATLMGLFIYQRLSKKLEDHLRDKILESEARSLISLSYAYYQTFRDTKELAPETSNVSISHAAQQAELASNTLSKIKTDSVDVDKAKKILGLRALALTNAAYYAAERKCLVEAWRENDHKHMDHERIAKQAVRLANESSLFVETSERNRTVEDLKWWDVVESRLWALRYCDLYFDKESAREKLETLLKDSSIPSAWKEEIKDDWEDILKTGKNRRKDDRKHS